jgi:hypothetical protein
MLSRPLSEDFQPLEVAKEIMSLLKDHNDELSVLRHTTNLHKASENRRHMGSIVMHQSLRFKLKDEEGEEDDDLSLGSGDDDNEGARIVAQEAMKEEEEVRGREEWWPFLTHCTRAKNNV